MASNALPATLDALLTLAEDMADGLHTVSNRQIHRCVADAGEVCGCD